MPDRDPVDLEEPEEALDAEEQARRDRRWRELQARPPAGSSPLAALGAMFSAGQTHVIAEAKRQRESGDTLAEGSLDVDLDTNTVVIRRPAKRPEA